MFTVTIDPVIFSIGHFVIRWYSLIAVGVIVLGSWIASKEARRRGLDENLAVGVVHRATSSRSTPFDSRHSTMCLRARTMFCKNVLTAMPT